MFLTRPPFQRSGQLFPCYSPSICWLRHLLPELGLRYRLRCIQDTRFEGIVVPFELTSSYEFLRGFYKFSRCTRFQKHGMCYSALHLTHVPRVRQKSRDDARNRGSAMVWGVGTCVVDDGSGSYKKRYRNKPKIVYLTGRGRVTSALPNFSEWSVQE